MRSAVPVAGAVLVAVGGAACAAAWAVAILAEASTTVDAAFVAIALAGAAVSLGVVAAFAVLPLGWNVKVGGMAAAVLFLVGVATLLAFVGFVIAPLGLLCLAASAHVAGPPLRAGGLALAASFVAYAGGAWMLESAGEDGAYAVAAFVPLFALAWIVLAYGIAAARIRPPRVSGAP